MLTSFLGLGLQITMILTLVLRSLNGDSELVQEMQNPAHLHLIGVFLKLNICHCLGRKGKLWWPWKENYLVIGAELISTATNHIHFPKNKTSPV